MRWLQLASISFKLSINSNSETVRVNENFLGVLELQSRRPGSDNPDSMFPRRQAKCDLMRLWKV
jgi:hypothetical protein